MSWNKGEKKKQAQNIAVFFKRTGNDVLDFYRPWHTDSIVAEYN